MLYLNIGLDSPVSVFDICQAHAQLEADYNEGGIVIERPSNKRRNESTGCQLARMGYSGSYRWVSIVPNEDAWEDDGDDVVRDIYLRNVLTWGLPIDSEMMAFIKRFYAKEFWASYPQTKGADYLQHSTTRVSA